MIRYSIPVLLLFACLSCSRQETPRAAANGVTDYVVTSNYLAGASAFKRGTGHAFQDIERIYVIVSHGVDENGTLSDAFSQERIVQILSDTPFLNNSIVVVTPNTTIPDSMYGDPKRVLLYVRPRAMKHGASFRVYVQYWLNRRVIYPWNNISENATVDSHSALHLDIHNEEELVKVIKADIEAYVEDILHRGDPSNTSLHSRIARSNPE